MADVGTAVGENVSPKRVGTRDVGSKVGLPVGGAPVGENVGTALGDALGHELLGTDDVGTAVGENV